jgi:hypothetical protein
MRTVCSWCDAEIKPEDGKGGSDSHGICPTCLEREEKTMPENATRYDDAAEIRSSGWPQQEPIQVTSEQIADLRREMQNAPLERMGSYPQPVTQGQFDRLLAILSLTPEERGFVRAALTKDAGKDLFLVLADYLEDRGQLKPAKRFRQQGEKVAEMTGTVVSTLAAVSTFRDWLTKVLKYSEAEADRIIDAGSRKNG